MRIAVDAMGGDRGPELMARAAIGAVDSDSSKLDIILVGDQEQVSAALRKSKRNHSSIEVVHASETVGMSEPPASAIRKKKDSSIAVAMRLLKEGKADALVSAGNTGAVVAGSLVSIGRLHGVSRPAIATFFPTEKRPTVFLDIGANSVCTPKNLLQFGVMGAVFAQYQLGIQRPRVGLLNIGEERSKGTDMVRAAYGLLEKSGVNFVGNVEGRDVMAGEADVVVCDGFVGNVVLKFTESILSFTSQMVRREIKKSALAKVGAFLMKRVFFSFRSRMDYAEYGGAPLLGINGVVIICHGKSSVRAVKNAILMAQRSVSHDINAHIEERFRGSVNDLANVS
ncbi:MAG: phosphate acyltransferase PlsX [Candidatus Krumholzibacteria bacterium]|nr:phosphate acyltransferase PlsX [Candidatus Krumholzibacteria bacterium]